MDNKKVSNSESAAPEDLASETFRSISPYNEWNVIMTDIVIEIDSVNVDHWNPAMIYVEARDSVSETAGEDALGFEKISEREWKYDGTIELTKEITPLFARWDDTENSGHVLLIKSELENLNKTPGSPNDIIREFQIEGNGPQMKLIFAVEVVQRGLIAPLGGRYSTYDALAQALSDDTEKVIAWVLDSPDKISTNPQTLMFIGKILLKHFLKTGAQRDIDNCVLVYKLSIQLLPVLDDKHRKCLHHYGMAVWRRYDLAGNLVDINEAIASLRKAVHLTPEGHVNLPAWLSDLKKSLQLRFRNTGDLDDNTEAISTQRKSIQLTPEGHPHLPIYLEDFGSSLQSRFRHTGDMDNISEAISSLRKSIQLTPEGHADLPSRLANLGMCLQSRFDHTGHVIDITEAISFQRKSIQLIPEGHADLPIYLNNLGISLRTRFYHTGDMVDISDAISSQRKSTQLTPEGHAYLSTYLNNLGSSLASRFHHTGDVADILEAISSRRRCIQLTPEGHPALPIRLNNLGMALQIRYEHTGDMVDISEAISSQRKSIQLTPEGHADLSTYLSNLGTSLTNRFDHIGDMVDNSEAISSLRKSIQLTPEGHADLPSRLNNLGLCLHQRFGHTGDMVDISEAISSQRKSIQLTPEGHAALPSRLDNYALSLRSRFRRTGDMVDILEAILSQRKSIQLTPEGHAALPSRLGHYALSLQSRFSRTEDMVDISEAISSQRKSIQLTPEGHGFLPDCLAYTGDSYALRYDRTNDAEDVHSAISHYQLAATSVSGSPKTRLKAAIKWVYWAQATEQSQLNVAYHTVMHLISQVAGLDQTIQKRYGNLIERSDLSSSAAAVAVAGKQYDLALIWLEQGRCLVWSQINDLRTPIDDLRADYPVLADEIINVSRALEKAGSREGSAALTPDTTMMTKIVMEEEAHSHIKLAREWDQLLGKVRALPQFEDFLKPPSCSALLQSIPSSGYVVVINIHKTRSDALVLNSGAKEPLHIALPEISYEMADSLRQELKVLLLNSGIRVRGSEHDVTRGSRRHVRGISNILSELWIFVVKPILNGLGYSTPASKLPRIWWCVSGPLAFLPIHAAGIYGTTGSTPGIYTSLFDFAISSYTPTVRSLIDRTQSFRIREVNPENMGMLMISQPDTPKLPPIPGTTVEVKAIQGLLDNHKIQHLGLESGDATLDRVKTSLDAYTCVHFACHASQDTNNPLQSGFSLYDGQLELSSIIKEHLTGADLAFLSACQTSTGDEKLSEEAVHLAGGMLAAGYRGVVATMWSIKDSYGPKLAEEFYKILLSHPGTADDESLTRLSGDNAAYALHYATQELRKTLGNSESSLLTWVPFVHFGV